MKKKMRKCLGSLISDNPSDLKKYSQIIYSLIHLHVSKRKKFQNKLTKM